MRGVNSYQVPADPTAVMGRRILAYLIDAILLALIAFGVFLALADHETFPSSVAGDICSSVRNTADSPVFCVNAGNDVYATEGSDSVVVILVSVGAWVVNYLLLQGVTGGTIGKHLTGIRCVRKSDGRPCGVGRALIRSIVALFEIGFCFLIALITALTTKGHRRLGDMAADTLVVSARAAGQAPVVPGLTAPEYAGAGAYAPPPGSEWGTSAYPGGGGWGTPPPPAPPPPGAPWGAPVPPAPTPPAPPAGEPWAAPHAPSPPAAPTAPAAEPSPWGAPAEPSPWVSTTAPEAAEHAPAPSEPAPEGEYAEAGAEHAAPDTSVFAVPGTTGERSELPLDRESERDADIAALDAQREPVWRPEPVSGTEPEPEPQSVQPQPVQPVQPQQVQPPAAEASAPSATEPATATASTMPGVGAPTWDPARNAYIQWDPALSRWMQWDDAAREWRPIS